MAWMACGKQLTGLSAKTGLMLRIELAQDEGLHQAVNLEPPLSHARKLTEAQRGLVELHPTRQHGSGRIPNRGCRAQYRYRDRLRGEHAAQTQQVECLLVAG